MRSNSGQSMQFTSLDMFKHLYLFTFLSLDSSETGVHCVGAMVSLLGSPVRANVVKVSVIRSIVFHSSELRAGSEPANTDRK